MKTLRLVWFLCGVSLQRLVEYRVDFLLGGLGFFLRFGVQAAVLGIVFTIVPDIQGWGLHQIIFLLGFSLLPRGLDKLFTDNLWLLGSSLIRSGEFFRYVVRPVNPLLLLVSERFLWPDALGELVTGLLLVGYATSHTDLAVSGGEALVVGTFFVLCGAAIYLAIKLLFASLAFWTTSSFGAMHAANQLSEFSGYPLELYNPTIRWILTWAIPFAFTGYFPASYLLFGHRSYVLWTPLVAVVSVTFALSVWSAGLRRYEATGT